MFINKLFKLTSYLNHSSQISASRTPISSSTTVLSAAGNNDNNKSKLIVPTHAQRVSKNVYTARRDTSAPKSPEIAILDKIFDKLFDKLIDPLQMTREEALAVLALRHPAIVDYLFRKKDISINKVFVETYFRIKAKNLEFLEKSLTTPEPQATTKKSKASTQQTAKIKIPENTPLQTAEIETLEIKTKSAVQATQTAETSREKAAQAMRVAKTGQTKTSEIPTLPTDKIITIKIPRRIPYPLAMRAAQITLSVETNIPSERNKKVAELRESFINQFNTMRKSNADLPMYGEEDSITNWIEISLHTKKTSLILKELGEISYFSEIQEAAIKNLRSVNLKQAIERQMADELDLEVDQESYCIEGEEHIPFMTQFLVGICRDIPKQLLEVRNEKGFINLTQALEASLLKIFVKSKEMSRDEFSRHKDVAIKAALEQLGVKIKKVKNTKNSETRFKKLS